MQTSDVFILFLLVLLALSSAKPLDSSEICDNGRFIVNGLLDPDKHCCRDLTGNLHVAETTIYLLCCEGAANPIYNQTVSMCNHSVILPKQDNLLQCGQDYVKKIKGKCKEESRCCAKRIMRYYWFRASVQQPLASMREKKKNEIAGTLLIPHYTLHNLFYTIENFKIEMNFSRKVKLNKWYMVFSGIFVNSKRRDLKLGSKKNFKTVDKYMSRYLEKQLR